MKTSKLRDLIKETIKENMDDRLKAAMGKSGFNDDETSDFFSKDTPSTKGISGYQKARDLITNLRSDYRSMSDDEMDDFTKEMVGHFIETTQGMAAAKVVMAKKGL